MREALMELSAVGEVEVFKSESARFKSRTWIVRFYSQGEPSHATTQSRASPLSQGAYQRRSSVSGRSASPREQAYVAETTRALP